MCFAPSLTIRHRSSHDVQRCTRTSTRTRRMCAPWLGSSVTSMRISACTCTTASSLTTGSRLTAPSSMYVHIAIPQCVHSGRTAARGAVPGGTHALWLRCPRLRATAAPDARRAGAADGAHQQSMRLCLVFVYWAARSVRTWTCLAFIIITYVHHSPITSRWAAPPHPMPSTTSCDCCDW